MEVLDPKVWLDLIEALQKLGFWKFVGLTLGALVSYMAITRILVPVFDVIGREVAFRLDAMFKRRAIHQNASENSKTKLN